MSAGGDAFVIGNVSVARRNVQSNKKGVWWEFCFVTVVLAKITTSNIVYIFFHFFPFFPFSVFWDVDSVEERKVYVSQNVLKSKIDLGAEISVPSHGIANTQQWQYYQLNQNGQQVPWLSPLKKRATVPLSEIRLYAEFSADTFIQTQAMYKSNTTRRKLHILCCLFTRPQNS